MTTRAMATSTTARLRLDAVTEADTDTVFAYCQNQELQRFVPIRSRESGEFLGVVERI